MPPPCDIIFMDPPYGAGLAQPALERAAGWLAPGGWISLETRGESVTPPPGLAVAAERGFGKARIHLIRLASEHSSGLSDWEGDKM